ncbi:MAG: hypothetical protein IJ518_03245 [Clostridia bacterium]|nr:hypothetical protein [Clostridia bacterium]
MPPKKKSPATTPEMENKRRSRQRRARRKAVLRGVVLVGLCALLFVLWQNWDTLAPDRLMDNLQDALGSGTGSFPVDVSGSGVQQLARSQNYLVVLSDSYLTYLNSSGAEINRYTCTYPSALLRTAGRYVLLAEQGGTRLQLNTRTATLTEITAEQEILSVAVNEKGQIAVLTQGARNYAVCVYVYDRQGKQIYYRGHTQLATEVALSADGKQVALLSLQTENGNLNTVVNVFSTETTQTAALCNYTATDTLLYRLEYLSGGWLAAIGETGAVMLDTADGLSTVFAPKDMRLLGYAASGEDLALVLRPYGSTGDGQVQVVSKSGDLLSTVDYTGEFRHLSTDGRQYLLLTDSYVQKITAVGGGGTAQVPADGQQAVLDGDRAVVLGLNVLQTYPLAQKQ